MVSVGPFQRIVGVYWPSGEATFTPKTTLRVFWGYNGVSLGVDGFYQDQDIVVQNTPPFGYNEYCTIEGIATPEKVATSYTETPIIDGQSIATLVTGQLPIWSPGDTFIFFDGSPDPPYYYSGSTLKVRTWTIVYRKFYNIFGLYKEEVISIAESTTDFDASSVRLRGSSGQLYAGAYFVDNYGSLVVTPIEP